MPFYHALVRPQLLTEAQRQQFGAAVVEVHCDVTGAPPSFVHALVSEDHEAQLPSDKVAIVNGVIRAGRTDAQKAEIATRLSEAMAATAGVPVEQVQTSTRDIEASYTMEGGVLLPEPGSPEEAEWAASAPVPAS